MYPNLYKGDTLPNIKFYEKKEEKKVTISSEIEILKESNKKLAIENITIKKENAELKNQISSFLTKLSDAEKSNTETKNDDFIAEKNTEEIIEKITEETTKETTEGNSIKDNLSKKTLSQLKELLNTEDFISFKEEWKSLSKKDDIIDFILKKIEEN